MKYGRMDTPLIAERTPSQVEVVRNSARATAAQLSEAPASRTLLTTMGLSAQHQMALSGEMESNYKARFPALPTEATHVTKPIFDYQSVLYKKDEVAFTKDYAWAHAKKSEVPTTARPCSRLLGFQLNFCPIFSDAPGFLLMCPVSADWSCLLPRRRVISSLKSSNQGSEFECITGRSRPEVMIMIDCKQWEMLNYDRLSHATPVRAFRRDFENRRPAKCIVGTRVCFLHVHD